MRYSRRNCILVDGVLENDYEVTDEYVVETVASDANVEINIDDNDRSHRLGKPRESKENALTIIVEFVQCDVWHRAFVN